MANPFEDPAVTQATAPASSNAGGESNVYGGGNAYGDSSAQQTQLSPAQQQMAVSVGSAVAKDVAKQTAQNVKNDYNENAKFQQDAYSAPETPNFCIKLFMWLPIRWLGWLGGILLVVFPILDWIFFKASVAYGIVGFYIIIFGLIIIFVESPSFALTRKPQLSIYYWFRLVSRMFGRAMFYMFISFLCFTEIEDEFTLTFVVGIYLLVVAVLMIVFSYGAASKYRRIFFFIASGTDPQNVDEMAGKLTRKFDELDADQDQKIGSLEIVKLATQAGRTLSNAERHAIQTFLDINCNGGVARDDFVNQFMNHNMRQKFL